jgi:hypothetical protein
MRKGLLTGFVVAAISFGAFAPSAFASGGAGGGGGSGGGSTAAGGATGGGTATGGGGGGAKAPCTNALTLSASATEDLAGNAFVASYTLVSCQSRTNVSMTATDLATGNVVWASVPDLAGTVALWSLPYKLTSYRIDARAVVRSTGVLVATASTVVDTLTPIVCDVYIHETATVGYWGIYPAIWLATDSRDCGLGGTSVHLRITNMTTGAVSLDLPGLSLSSFVDFEGGFVSYNTPYHIEAELRSSSGEVLQSTTTDVMSSVLR